MKGKKENINRRNKGVTSLLSEGLLQRSIFSLTC